MTVKRKKFSIIVAGSIAAAIVSIIVLSGYISSYAKNNYLYPCVDKRIDDKMSFSNTKIDIMYKYLMETAKINGTKEVWNKCVDDVYTAEAKKVSKF